MLRELFVSLHYVAYVMFALPALFGKILVENFRRQLVDAGEIFLVRVCRR